MKSLLTDIHERQLISIKTVVGSTVGLNAWRIMDGVKRYCRFGVVKIRAFLTSSGSCVALLLRETTD